MISKHIDLIAIAILLFAVAVFGNAQRFVTVTLAQPFHYYQDGARQVRMPVMPRIPRIPDVPQVPKIPLQRD